MAKKEFKRVNPAEAFITIPEEENTEEQTMESAEGSLPSSIEKPLEETGQETIQGSIRVEDSDIPWKISESIPKGYKLNPKFIETKSKKVQLLLQPSVVEAIKASAKQNGISMNEAINQAIQEYLVRH